MDTRDQDQMEQIAARPTWDGNLISKTSRDRLEQAGWIVFDPEAQDPDPHVWWTGAWVATN